MSDDTVIYEKLPAAAPASVPASKGGLDPDVMYADLEKKIEAGGVKMDMNRIRAAYEMAKAAHEGQFRKEGSPYVTHCVAAAEIAVDMGLDEDSIVATLLHDIIEDTDLATRISRNSSAPRSPISWKASPSLPACSIQIWKICRWRICGRCFWRCLRISGLS